MSALSPVATSRASERRVYKVTTLLTAQIRAGWEGKVASQRRKWDVGVFWIAMLRQSSKLWCPARVTSTEDALRCENGRSTVASVMRHSS